jgi:beta-catenin-like protein 1
MLPCALALQCALIVGALWLVGDLGVRKRILRLLHQKGRTLGSLRAVLLEYRANLGDDGGLGEGVG